MLSTAQVLDVVARLGLAHAPRPDHDGLAALYSAWCERVPFDNALKLRHLQTNRDGPLPGSTGETFFSDWLACGAGGTCWAGNGALFELLTTLGFRAERAIATMMASPDTPSPNHGSVVVSLDDERFIVDASILTRVPLRLPRKGEALAPSRDLPRVEARGEKACVIWRTMSAPDGFVCRFEEIGIDASRWDALHQATAAWGPFNYAVSARTNRGARTIGYTSGKRFEFDAEGILTTTDVDRGGRDRVLIDEIGILADLVRALDDDRPMPPRPT